MILLDASVLINFFRNRDSESERALDSLDLGICGVTRAEILHGARDDADKQKLSNLISEFVQVPTPETIWDQMGQNLRTLRSQGIVVPFPDVLLATIALSLDAQVWAADRHFMLLRNIIGVQLFDPDV